MQWRGVLVLIVVLHQLGDVLSTDADQASESTAEVSTACKRPPAAECAPPTGRKVCGTDNTTYDSMCLLRLARCQGRAVELRHRGPCKDPQPCFADLARYYVQQKGQPGRVAAPGPRSGPGPLLSSSSSSSSGPQSNTFLPKCRKDGTYAAVQCHHLTGYCWCVTRRGHFVRGSTTSKTRPKCARAAIKTRRGSSPGHRIHKRGCGHMERSTFNSNLIKIFRAEYERSSDVSVDRGSGADRGAGADPNSDGDRDRDEGEDEGQDDNQDPERRVLDWKFARLDVDKDGILRRPEYTDLRRLVRKVVKPKRCARTFGRLCDLDRDRNISRHEWAACFGLDFSMLQESGRPSESNSDLAGRPLSEDEAEDDDDPGNLDGDSDRKNSAKLDLQERPQFPLDRDRSDNGDAEATDCISDRQAVLDEQRSSSMTTNDPYVPECTADGRYTKKQCYNSTGYCWCVHEDSGKPIPGTSVRHQNPSCDVEKIQPRPFMGCPEPAKQIFLENLIDFLRLKMSLTPTKTGPSVLKSSEDEVERIVTWTFAQFDVNKNKVLERREWKTFRQMVSASKQLRRCGKKLPRHCDVNHDRKISMTEWLDCTRPREAMSRSQHWQFLSSGQRRGQGNFYGEDSPFIGSGISSPGQRGNSNNRGVSRRKGSNPVERYLKP